jgi:RimJ/RimL family protein N-acetyltransferase
VVVPEAFSRSPGVCRLRSAQPADAEFIIELRSNPELSRFVHAIDPNPVVQRAFIAAECRSTSNWYFIVEDGRSGQARGTIALYNVVGLEGELGRWLIGGNSSIIALDSIFQLYEFAFDCCGLQRVYTKTRSDNLAVVSFHTSLGATLVTVHPRYFSIGGQCYDAVEQSITAHEWSSTLAPNLRARLQRLHSRRRPLSDGC